MSLFDDLLRLEEKGTSKSFSVPLAASLKTAASSAAGAKPAAVPSAPQQKTGLTNARPPEPPHTHPARTAASTVQKVDYVQYGTEGCAQHYNDRIVPEAESAEKIHAPKDYSRYIDAMVLGEVLAKPRFRNPWGKK